MPAFETQYAADAGAARSAASDDIATMLPRLRTRWGSAARQIRNAPVRLVRQHGAPALGRLLRRPSPSG